MTAEVVKLTDARILILNNYDSVDKNACEHQNDALAPSSARFIVAILIFLTSALNGFIQCSFVTIWQISMNAYDVDALSINMLTALFGILFIPGSLVAIALYTKAGVSSCITASAVLNLFSCVIRYASFISNVPHNAFWIIFVGQSLAAVAMPLLLNIPSRVANDWFPKKERDLAISFMSQSNYLGAGLGALIPSYQVHTASDISSMLFSQAVVATAIFSLTMMIVPHHSPVHAGFDAVYQTELRAHLDTSNVYNVIRQMMRDFVMMLSNPDFALLLVSFSFQVGILWTMGIITGQLIQPCGYSNTVVGYALLLSSLLGILGSFAMAFVLREQHQHYFFIYKITMISTTVACVIMLGLNRPGNAAWLLCSWALLGFVAGPLTSISLELGAELTYPIPANTSATLIFTSALIFNFACTVFLTPLLTLTVSTQCASVITPSSISICLLSLSAVLVALPIQSMFNRRDISAKEFATRNIIIKC